MSRAGLCGSCKAEPCCAAAIDAAVAEAVKPILERLEIASRAMCQKCGENRPGVCDSPSVACVARKADVVAIAAARAVLAGDK